MATTIAVITDEDERLDGRDHASLASVEGHETADRRRHLAESLTRSGETAYEPANSSTIEPSARKGPKGMPIVLPARPCRTSKAIAGITASSIASISAGRTLRPSAAPMRKASFTSPMPMPAG